MDDESAAGIKHGAAWPSKVHRRWNGESCSWLIRLGPHVQCLSPGTYLLCRVSIHDSAVLLPRGRCCFSPGDVISFREMLLFVGRHCFSSGNVNFPPEMLIFFRRLGE